MAGPLRIVVLASGGGTTFENLVVRSRDGRLPGVEIVALGLSRPGLGAAEKAKRLCVPALVMSPQGDDKSPEALGGCIDELLEFYDADLCLMAGWVKLWKIPKAWEGRVMNIHPSLLPSFGGRGMYGHHVHEAVVATGVKVTGCTVHFADNAYDTGPIILQRTVPVGFADTADEVAAKVMEAEREAYPAAVELYRDRRLKVVDRRVQVLSAA